MQNVQLSYQQKQNQRPSFRVSILCHDMRAPGNVGSIFRIADAFGVERVYLTGTSVVPPHPKIRKTSRSAEHHVPFSHGRDPLEVVRGLRADGHVIVSLEITSASVDLREFSLSGHPPLCLVLGSEQTGVPQELLDLSDHTVHIPMFGHNLSMNVATACAVAVFELVRRQATPAEPT